MFGSSLVSCPLSTKMDNSMLAKPLDTTFLLLHTVDQFFYPISLMTTSKFTCDVQHGTFCEDTSKSRLIGKETTQYTWRGKQIVRSRKTMGMGRRQKRRERVTEPNVNKRLKAPTIVSLLQLKLIVI